MQFFFFKKEEQYEELFKPGAKKFHFPKYKKTFLGKV